MEPIGSKVTRFSNKTRILFLETRIELVTSKKRLPIVDHIRVSTYKYDGMNLPRYQGNFTLDVIPTLKD